MRRSNTVPRSFRLTNALRATVSCNLSTSNLPKCARATQCHAHFDSQMWLAPQRRAIYPDRIVQILHATLSFSTLWLRNVLLATALCNFPRSIFQNVHDKYEFFHILTYKCASHHSRVPFFVSLLNSYLRTRRFSEPTFRTSGTTNHWKNTAVRDIPNIWRVFIFLLVTLLACRSAFYWLDHSATLLFNCTYCRKLDF